MQFESIRGADAGFLLAKFRGVDDRDAAELLRGASICVDRARFPDLEEGEFYVCDVIGARVVGASGQVGVVEDFVTYPSADVLVVRPVATGRNTVELPLVDDFIEVVDTRAAEVRLTLGGVAWFEGVTSGKTNHAN
jgi:16S rRNA processing protein RimM